MAWWIVNGEEKSRAHPETFKIPSEARRKNLAPGDLAKLDFETDEPAPEGHAFAGSKGERMWATIERVDRDGRYHGHLNSKPFFLDLEILQALEFGPEHVINIDRVCCVDCKLRVPQYEVETELDAAGWATRPHPNVPAVKLRVCPACAL